MSSPEASPGAGRRARPARLRTPSLETASMALGATIVCASTAWSGDAWQASGGDYAHDYEPAMRALLGGHLARFFHTLPTNGAGGSVLLRAPFSGLAGLLGGGQLLAFRLGALACLLAVCALALQMAHDACRRAVGAGARVGLVAICAASPALLEAVSLGHPEEPLGAALCVAAVLAAGADRPLAAGLLLGAGVINKPWGVLAIGPVLLCARPGIRGRMLAPAGAIVGGWLAAAALLAPARLLASLHGAEASIVAHPQDLWWPLSHMDGLYPVPPALLAAHARQLAVALAVAAAAALAWRTRRARGTAGTRGALALLALCFALRCLLEPSSHGYYQVPLLVALAAWELRARGTVAISLASTILLALDFGRLNESATATGAYLLYLAVLAPICALLLADMAGRYRPRTGGEALTAAPLTRPPSRGLPRRSRSPSGAC